MNSWTSRISAVGRSAAAVFRINRKRMMLMLAIASLSVSVPASQAFAGSATVTTLAVTSAGKAVTSVNSGTLTVLTASVKAGTVPVPHGQVNFCDATAAHCTDVHIIASGALTSTGEASIKLTPGVGNHSYKAVFVGTTSYTASASAVSALTVTGTHPTTTAISSDGVQGDYSITATVGSVGAATSPSGTLSLLDTTTSNSVLAKTSLAPGTSGLSFYTPGSSPTGIEPVSIVAADFNGDGKADIATVNQYLGTVSVLLGNGNGTFIAMPDITVGANSATGLESLAVGDFNGDGKFDLAFVNPGGSSDGNGTVTILLGKGDGTFTAISNPSETGVTPYAPVVGDFNSDGKADLAMPNINDGTVTILLGNGDGTFTAATPPQVGTAPLSASIGDFNGDGKQDLAVVNEGDSTVSILLGNGDGTFTTGITAATDAYPHVVVTADFNQDGKADLAVVNWANLSQGTVTILLGNGDGTFTAAARPTVGIQPYGFAYGDFNNDGKADLIALNFDGTLSLLLGNGNGTFIASPASPATNESIAYAFTLGDFNGDGWPDIAVADVEVSMATVLLSATETSTATLSGISPAGTGTHLVTASYPGDTNFSASASGPLPLTASNTVTTLTSSANPQNSGVPVTFTISVKSVSGSGIPTGYVYSTVDGADGPSGQLTNGTASFTTSTLLPGKHSIIASYEGSGSYTASAATLTQTIVGPPPASITVVSGASQTAVYGTGFTNPLVAIVKDAKGNPLPGAVVSFSGSGLSFSSASATTGSNGEASVTVSPTAAGSLTATASTSGLATTATFALTSSKAPLTVTANNASMAYGHPIPTFSYSVTGFVNEDTQSVLTGSPSETTTATSGSLPGTYPITITQGTLAAANYSFSFVNAVLTVTSLGVTATPSFSPAPGTYYAAQSVTISDAIPGSVLYYTTNGATPTTSSTKYTGPISVSATETIQAAAIAPGYSLSGVGAATYSLQAATPTFSPSPGTYIPAQSVTLADTTAGTSIFYTTNGTTPTSASTKYTAPIPVSASTTILAIATETGYAQSAVATGAYVITPPSPAPVFSLKAGSYTTTQNVVITDIAAGTTIFYTTNGTIPTTASSVYTAPISVPASATIQAFATGNGYSNGPIASVSYAINPPPLSQTITTVAGDGQAGNSGTSLAPNTAMLNYPAGVAVDAAGNLYIADTGNNQVRAITTYGLIITVAGNGSEGYSGDGGIATQATLSSPTGIAVDAAGNLYIADSGNSVIRKVSGTTITTFAGNGNYGYSGDGGAATSAALNYPEGLAFDAAGNLYIADTYNNIIRKVSTTGNITTVVGSGDEGYSGDGGPALHATFSYPASVAVDASGRLYIADTGNSVIRRVALNQVITTVAGNGKYGFTGNGSAATSATLSSPTSIALDAADSIYIADSENNVIREVTPDGIIHVIAGNGSDDYSGDGGAATSAGISLPTGVAINGYGNLYIADSNNNVIRMVAPIAAAPAFSPVPGTYPAALAVAMTSTTPGAKILFTFDGGVPNGKSYSYQTPFNVSSTMTLKAIARAEGYAQSAVASGTYTITPLTNSPSSASFGSIPVGSTSPIITVTATNYTKSPAAYLSYFNLDTFNFEPGTCGPIETGTMLAGGATCTFKVSFSPTSVGTVSGSFTISTVNGPVTYTLSGTGTHASAHSALAPARPIGQPITSPILGRTPLPSGSASGQGQLLVVMSHIGGTTEDHPSIAEGAVFARPDVSTAPATSDVPSGAKPATATPNTNLVVMTVWYANFSNCTTAGTGSITASPMPQYGTVSSQGGSVELPPGFACAGVSLPATQAFYNWNNSSSVTFTDAFTLNYVSSDNAQKTSKSVFVTLLGDGTGKVKTRPGGCSTCSTVDPGDPIDLGSGNVFEEVDDYATYGANKLSFSRYYNSLGVPNTTATMLGDNWRSTYDRYLNIISSTHINAERADGEVINFTLIGNIWIPPADTDYKLVQNGLQYVLTDRDDNVETYGLSSAVLPIQGITIQLATAPLLTIKARNGYIQTLNRTSGVLESVTDSYGRSLNFTYNGTSLSTVTTPDGLVITFGYNTVPGGTNNQLASVSYSTTPVTAQHYLYGISTLPLALTGITDENGNAFATWNYDQLGRGISSQFGPGAEASSITYNDTDGSRVLTGALGQSETYKFTVVQQLKANTVSREDPGAVLITPLVPKLSEIDRTATSTTAAATRLFTYDASGYLASQTDWNGNLTKYVNNSHGEPTSIVEASGSPVARTTGVTWLSTLHLPSQIVTPGVTVGFTYDSLGELLTKTLTDTTTQTVPYSTKGQARTWTYTWLNSLLASVQTPLKNTTKFTYDASGAVVKVVNPLSQATNITAHSGGGQPETIVDPNGVTTQFTYDPRRYLIKSELFTRAGVLTTALNHDAVEDLVSVDLPGGSILSYTYDTAHRLAGVTDKLGNKAAFTLDALADQTAANLYAKGSTTASGQHSATFDALGRKLTDIGGVGQTTTFTYDNQGNALTITDPLKHQAKQVFDALNRLSQITDANSGITAAVYDAHDRPTKITAPNKAATTFIYNGFGDVIEQVSPDSGTTVYTYDADGNLTQKTDALKIVANYTYDALDRPLTVKYPADTTQNVAYTYDQTGHGFGIGKLTSLTDAVGSLSRTYDERGNLLSEKRVNGATTFTTGYGYDQASRLASITYPSGEVVQYTRDGAGRVVGATAGKTDATAATVVSGMGYLPFGPDNALTFGNGIAEARSFDADYRMIGIADTGTAAAVIQKLTYGFDAANNVLSIADGVTAANSQTLGYDVLNRLTTATGSYGTLGYGYDANGNRLKQTLGSVTTTYTYSTASNILASYTTGSTTTTVATNSNGNITSIPPANSIAPATFAYNVANRLSSVVGSPIGASFLYDAFGQRFSKADPGYKPTTYIYGPGGTLLEENDNGTVTDYLYANGRPVGTYVPSTGKVYFIQTDHLGTPQLVTDGTQKTVWKTTYQPFGTTGLVTASITQNLRFPGQYADTETGFSYNMNRDYMPNLGRYSQVDPIDLIAGTNPYSYAGQNPVAYSDFFGLDYITVTNYHGFPGHVGISVNGGQSMGYYGTPGSIPQSSEMESSSMNGPGGEFADSSRGNDGNNTIPSDSVTIEVSPLQAQFAQDALDGLVQFPGQYNLATRNCATAVEDVLRYAGVPNVPTTPLPFLLVTELQINNVIAALEKLF